MRIVLTAEQIYDMWAKTTEGNKMLLNAFGDGTPLDINILVKQRRGTVEISVRADT